MRSSAPPPGESSPRSRSRSRSLDPAPPPLSSSRSKSSADGFPAAEVNENFRKPGLSSAPSNPVNKVKSQIEVPLASLHVETKNVTASLGQPAELSLTSSMPSPSPLKQSKANLGSGSGQKKWGAVAHPEVSSAVRHQHTSLMKVFHMREFRKKSIEEVGRVRSFLHHSWAFIYPVLCLALITFGFLAPQVFSFNYTWIDSPKQEEDPDLPRRYRSFNEANVPPLRAWTRGESSGEPPFTHFEELGSQAYSPPHGNNCTAVWRGWLEDRVSSLNGLTDPAQVRLILDLFELTNISEVRALKQIDDLLREPQDFRPMLKQASDCAETNAPLQAYACQALSDQTLQTRLQTPAGYDDSFVEEELIMALHYGVVLETLTAAAVVDTSLREAVHWQMTLIASRVYERIKIHVQVIPTHRQYFEPLEVAFKKQKWHSIETAERQLDLLKLEGGDAMMAMGIQLSLAMNIMEAAHLELVDGVHSNVELGLALAVGAQSTVPRSKDLQLLWPLGKAWADAYVAWNLEYVSHFETVHHPVKLLIPSLLCHDESAIHFFDARTFSLKLFMVYYTNRRDRNYVLYGTGSRGNGVWNATLSERRAMGEVFVKHSKLPKPSPSRYGHGALQRLFDSLDPPHGWLDFVTSDFSNELFLLYSTLCIWITVCAAGFGSEVVLGEHIVRQHGNHDDHEWLSVSWHAAQLAFSLFLTVALFAHSAIGLPFLVLGLWKGGFPETVCCFLAAFINGGTLSGVCLLLDGLGFVLHHSMTAFTIVSLTTGLFPATRQIIGCCVIPVMQHWFVLLRYHSRFWYTVIELVLEVYFQIEVLSYVPYFVTPWGHDFDLLGRGVAITMLLSHWIWFISATLRIVEKRVDAWLYGEEEVYEEDCVENEEVYEQTQAKLAELECELFGAEEAGSTRQGGDTALLPEQVAVDIAVVDQMQVNGQGGMKANGGVLPLNIAATCDSTRQGSDMSERHGVTHNGKSHPDWNPPLNVTHTATHLHQLAHAHHHHHAEGNVEPSMLPHQSQSGDGESFYRPSERTSAYRPSERTSADGHGSDAAPHKRKMKKQNTLTKWQQSIESSALSKRSN
ncbi:hypothetical protein AB1Y20_006340 [Prymnesium parvum]|uniref:Transmembrane protein n=1 Tax=Prymnesium parvum TaxID=97485 RepID=A0AB34J2Z2_PRYPA